MPEKFTQQRLDPMKASPGVYKAMMALQSYVEGCGLEHPLLKLVEVRTSQINGCAFCLAMHTKDARKAGESDERMHLLGQSEFHPVGVTPPLGRCFQPVKRQRQALGSSLDRARIIHAAKPH